jgi:hypothetical protein
MKKNNSRTARAYAVVALIAGTCTWILEGSAQAAPTRFLNQDQLIHAYAPDAQWYKSNIPFFEISNPRIQQIYYYRWNLTKAHIRNLGGRKVITEFLNEMSWDQKPSNTISDAVGFHIYEARWLKDQRVANDDIDHWYSGDVTPRQYSEWIADATYQKYLVDMDQDFVIGHLGDMKRVYNEWYAGSTYAGYDASKGLFWIVPLSDATEYTISSIDASGGADGFFGGDSFRPSINSYMYANARAISNIAALSGDAAAATDYSGRASALKATLQASLWNPEFHHFVDRYHVNNEYVSYWDYIRGRELVGYVPWYYGIPDNTATFNSAWAHLTDPAGFQGQFGLRTVEPGYEHYMQQYRYDAATGLIECQWNGPSWPYQTTQVLGGMANLLNNYTQLPVSKSTYLAVLNQYTSQHYKDGQPYISENYHPDQPGPHVDLPERSQHYLHSGYIDLIITGLAGLRPRADNILEINPLIPSDPADPNYVSYFALEDVKYHGHSVTILWDADGTRYRQGKGLSVFIDGERALHSSTAGKKTVAMAPPHVNPPAVTRLNYAANPSGTGYPEAAASFSAATDPAAKATDGRIWYYQDTKNRWSALGSNNATDWFSVDFGTARTVTSAKLYLFADGDAIAPPARYTIQYWDGSNWKDAGNQRKSPAIPAANTVNTVSFDAVNTSRLRAVFTNAGAGKYTGMTEFEAYGNEVTSGAAYRLVNYHSAKVLGLSGTSTGSAAQPVQWSDNNADDHNWRLDLQANGYYRIVNLSSNKALGVGGISKASGAQAFQWSDGAAQVQEWKVERMDDGLYRITDRQSGKVLGMDQANTADGAPARLGFDTGAPGQRWALPVNTGLASGAVYRIANFHSGQVMGIAGASTADGTEAVQWPDTGTTDHDWKVQLLRDGSYKFTNVNSNEVLAIDQMLNSYGAWAVQLPDTGAAHQSWTLLDAGNGRFKLLNRHSGKVLGVDGMSTDNGAHVLQWSDNGTDDHVWSFTAVQ